MIETIQTAVSSTVESLKGTPGFLVVVLLNVLVLVLLFTQGKELRKQSFDEKMTILRHCLPAAQIPDPGN